uniref:ADP-ribosylation factor-like protein 5B n=1 Tax=Parascaris equorum TaxID=6256 RepID=A0A914RN43_PAREQ
MGEAVHTSPTIGSNVEEVIWRNIHFIMWDVGGQESLRASWSSYYTHTQFVILTHRWQIQACCALTGEGIEKGLEWIASSIT